MQPVLGLEQIDKAIQFITMSSANPLCQVWVEFSGKREESAPLLGAECPQGKAERGMCCGTPEDRLLSLDRQRGFGGGGNRDIAVRHAWVRITFTSTARSGACE